MSPVTRGRGCFGVVLTTRACAPSPLGTRREERCPRPGRACPFPARHGGGIIAVAPFSSFDSPTVSPPPPQIDFETNVADVVSFVRPSAADRATGQFRSRLVLPPDLASPIPPLHAAEHSRFLLGALGPSSGRPKSGRRRRSPTLGAGEAALARPATLPEPIPGPPAALAASIPWLVYWCLAGRGAMKGCKDGVDDVDGADGSDGLGDDPGVDAESVAATLDACWWSGPAPSDKAASPSPSPDTTAASASVVPIGPPPPPGGFGGGPGQAPHAAPTFAALAALTCLGPRWVARVLDGPRSSPCRRAQLARFLASRCDEEADRLGASDVRRHGAGAAVAAGGEGCARAVYCCLAAARLAGLDRRPPPPLSRSEANAPNAPNANLDAAIPRLPFTLGQLDSSGRLRRHLLSSQSPEGGWGAERGAEPHAGYSYCALASLALLREADDLSQETAGSPPILPPPAAARARVWALGLQCAASGGLRGRTAKLADACYSWWGGTLPALIERASGGGNGRPSERSRERAKPDEAGGGGGRDVEGAWAQAAAVVDALPPGALGPEGPSSNCPRSHAGPSPLDAPALAAWILSCCQCLDEAADPTAPCPGGLRDKPGKASDYYHTCYGLLGLSAAAHACGSDDENDKADAEDGGPTGPVAGALASARALRRQLRPICPLLGVPAARAAELDTWWGGRAEATGGTC